MNQFERLREIITTYERHGWHLERVLLRPETRALFDAAMISEPNVSFAEAIVRESTVDAMWFKREAAQTGREAWELRLVADTPYALFETFEADEAEEDREDVRREMEALLLEKMRPAASPPNHSS